MANDKPEIIDIYDLSPMQQGMLFHTLESPDSGVYHEQVACLIEGHISPEAFRKASQLIVDRHSVLRTSFVVAKSGRMVQVVQRKAELPWTELDWRGLPADEQQRRLDEYIEQDRLAAFALTKPPLMRMGLIRLADDRWNLVWSNHHIAYDGWSMSLFVSEVMRCYQALLRHESPVLPPVRPYRDYIGWLQKQDQSAAERFWRSELAGFAAPTPLVLDGVGRIPETSDGSASESVSLSSEVSASLNAVSRRCHVTLSTLIQGAWAILLASYSGESDVVFGNVVSGRPADLAGIESMGGLFINTLPVRVSARSDAIAADLLRELQTRQAEMRQYEYTPLVDIHRWSEVPTGMPLFETMLAFENYPLDSAVQSTAGEDPGFRISDIRYAQRTQYAISLISNPAECIPLTAIYQPSRFSAESVRQMLRHLCRILEGMAADPDRKIADLSMISDTERRYLLEEWNQTTVPYPSSKTAVDLFDETAARFPNAVAVTDGIRSMTYDELHSLANRMSNYLCSHGVGPDVLVGICMERSLEMVVAMLGIQKAGGAYLPLDPQYPSERLRFMISDAQAPVILTCSESLNRLPESNAVVICLDRDWPAILDAPAVRCPVAVHPDSLAYVIYTSGSTGRPKGTMIPHSGLCNLVTAVPDAIALSPGARVLQFASMSFDAAVWDIFITLANGATLCLRPHDEIAGSSLFQWMDDEGITHAVLPPALLASVDDPVGHGPSTIVSAGEDCPADLAERWCVGRRFMNGYGPTESTVCATLIDCARFLGGHPPIGLPVRNIRVYVLDGNLQPVPIGVAGEICISGAGLARGYLNRPGLTAEKFIPDPFSGEPGVRMYRTGDLARRLPDGNLEFLGRIDHQVKIRGFRIELGEIEAALRRYPGIEDAVVIARADSGGEKLLAAYVVSADRPDTSLLRQHLKDCLPDYMVPSSFATLGSLPLTPSGKVDRAKLGAMSIDIRQQADAEGAYEAPSTRTEEQVADIYARILGLERVGRTDSFFDLGGHSIRAVSLMNAVRREMGHSIALAEILRSPRVMDLARTIDDHIGEDPIQRVPDADRYPLSYAQKRLWALQCMDPENAAYNIPAAARLDGPLDRSRLETALRCIIDRHESLRTRYHEIDGEPWQVVGTSDAFRLEYHDLTGMPDVDASVADLAQMDAARPFDLGCDLPIRGLLLQTGPTTHVLVVNIHHIAVDGWSMHILLHELGIIYAGKGQSLPDMQLQYRDYASWQERAISGTTGARDRAYWMSTLGGDIPKLDLPSDRPRPAEKTYNGSHVPFAIDGDALAQLHVLSRETGTSVFAALTALVSVLLHRYTRSEDIAIGTPVAGRERAELDGQVGLFVNTLVLRNKVVSSMTFGDLLRQTKLVVGSALEHQGYPFDRIVDDLRVERELSRSPLFDVMVTMQNTPPIDLQIPGVCVTPIEIDSPVSKFDLSFTFAEEPGKLLCDLEYNTDLFNADTIQRMSGHLGHLLRSSLADPSQAVMSLDMLSAAEHGVLVHDLNAPSLLVPQDETVISHLERHASIPDCPAVISGSRVLTYAELNPLSLSVAGYLLDSGMRPGDVIGVAMPRSIDLIVAFYGILRAGGVYLPLNTEYPDQRLGFMLMDSECAIVIGNSEIARRCSGSGITVIDPALASAAPSTLLSPAIEAPRPEDCAYIIYTSGSTGQPKGVSIDHRSLNNYVNWAGCEFGLGRGDVSLPLASISFDASVSELVYGLDGGAAVALIEPGDERIPDAVLSAIRRYHVTSIQTTPALLRVLLDRVGESDSAPDQLALRQVLVGGEGLSGELVGRFYDTLGSKYGVRLCNVYGPTETTVDAACHWCTELDSMHDQVPIGRPVANTRIYVLEPSGLPAPIGVPGEICIAGVSVARGYLNRPDLTDRSFVPDPFVEGGRMYRSGDIGRWRADGTVQVLGRLDDQVKLRGYRIELGEVESSLRQIESIREAVVLPDAENGRLCAYLVMDGDMGTVNIRRRLSAHLPDYMVPSSYRIIDSVPLTPSGKVDRRRLLGTGSVLSMDEERQSVSTDTERAILAIWQEVLSTSDEFGPDDDFFESGGNSLLVVRLHRAIARQWPGAIGMADLFRLTTIAAQAASLDSPARVAQDEAAGR